MRICIILEGCYPYVTGGVSSWIHEYMQAMSEHEFVLWLVGADSGQRGKFKYTLPENVVEVQELFLGDALKKVRHYKRHTFTDREQQVLRDLIRCGHPDWEVLFDLYQKKGVDPLAFLMSEDFLNILTSICEEEYPYTAFSDLFHTLRSMFLPVLYILQSKVPKADVYHAIATGYSGILARLGSYMYHAPYIVTEHGIYTREREEEIIRAQWVLPDFKEYWVHFFYMLSDGAYERATRITSLFAGAMKTQIDMGCRPEKCSYIGNGIHYEKFSAIPPRKPDGYINIAAIVRMAPIKDVKTMIYAFSELKRRVPNARLWIIGPEEDKKYAEECYQLAERLDVQDLTFPGRVNVAEVIETYDFTILTSISEGMPLSILESFAAGKPCVVTDVGCCKELIRGVRKDDDLGPAGYCVPPMDIQGIAHAMEALCLSREDLFRMGMAGRERVRRYFRHEEMMERYRQLYEEVINEWLESVSV